MRLLCDGIQSRNPKESELLERSEDEHVLLCIWYILIHLPFLFDIHSACESLLMMPISFENIRSEPHDMAGVGLEPDLYPMEELTPEKLITEKTGDGPAAGNTGIDSFTNLSLLSMGLD